MKCLTRNRFPMIISSLSMCMIRVRVLVFIYEYEYSHVAANSGVHIMVQLEEKIGCVPLLAISQLIRGEVAVWCAPISPRKSVCLSVVA
ncbi:hypothetical protein D910_04692 [Dendroctonus ponderosae]|uniref:Uncharacterized protein n=1 Tax=Dendroctonus ponderosae TaxID=77166 RepID=U4U2K9_DENPD|nr:hypothetical protein D910_04692 [Dendroctonus ponderosae]